MTNRQWLMWKLIDMSDKELLKHIPGVMCYVCTKCITPHLSCKEDCRSMILDWLKKERKEG